jgi:hypothetical protein
MKKMLKKLAAHSGDASVTIIAKTHRTRPDNLQDPILIKNLIKEAEHRLLDEYTKDVADDRINKLRKLAAEIDYDNNLEGLILVAGAETAEALKLPVSVENRVVIDHSFATRDLVRSMAEQSEYYVLVLSRQQARLIKAFNNEVIAEHGNPFPIENNDLYATDKQKLSTGRGTDNLIEEFFNRIDKEVQEIVKSNRVPVVLATEKRNYDHYLKMTDHQIVVAHLNMNRDDEKAHQIVSAAWPVLHDYLHSKNEQRISELKQAVGQQRFMSDLSDIWRAVNEGRGETLFVKRGYFQPARIENEQVIPVDSPNGAKVIDDIVDEMIELNQQHGGDTVFMEGHELDEFHGVALTARY